VTYFIKLRKNDVMNSITIEHLVKSRGERKVIKGIIQKGKIDRTSLAKLCRMSVPAVSKIVRSFLNKKMVIEIGESESSGGRRPILITINADYRFAVGVKIGLGYIVLMLIDILGNIRGKNVIEFDHTKNPTIIIELIARTIRELLQKFKVRKKLVLGVGIAVSGAIDQRKGVVKFSGILGWSNVPIRDTLEKRLKIPVILLNDVKSFTLAQLWKGDGKKYRNFLCITIGTGIGMGVVVNGKLYTGLGSAGEFGHVVVNPKGKKCTCGKVGCLETESSFHAIIEHIKENTTSKNLKSAISSLELDEVETKEIELLKISKEKDPEVFNKAFQKASLYLGIGIVDLVNIFNPPLIVIGGEALEFKEYFLSNIVEYVNETAFDEMGKQVSIVNDSIGEDAWPLGVAYLITQKALGEDLIPKEVVI